MLCIKERQRITWAGALAAALMITRGRGNDAKCQIRNTQGIRVGAGMITGKP